MVSLGIDNRLLMILG